MENFMKYLLIGVILSMIPISYISIYADEVKKTATEIDLKKQIDDPVELSQSLLSSLKKGHYWHASALVIMLIMFGLKRFEILKHMGRSKYIILPILSVIAALLVKFQDGISWEIALSVLVTCLSTGKLQELWEHGILGKMHGEKSP